jgi:hypothetical protein
MKHVIAIVLSIALCGCATVTRTDQYGNTTTSTEFDPNALAAIAIGAAVGASAASYSQPTVYYAPAPVYVIQPTYVAPRSGFVLPRPY